MHSFPDFSTLKGLSEIVATERLKMEGYNELPASKKRSVFKIVWDVVREPMFILLILSGSIYLFLGDKEEAFMLLGFVFVVLGITIYQENKTEKALDALRNLSSPRALVIRDGIQKRIAGRDVVRDDIIIVKEGDRIPADAVLIWSINLSADESLLTGESVPVRKIPNENVKKKARPGGDDLPFIYSGSLIVQGQGIARVIGTGMQTEMGKIGKALQQIENEETVLQKETRRLVKAVAIIAFFLTVLVVAIYGFSRGEWLNGVLSGITLAMAMLPEEFPVVLTVFLALGAWRISKKHVLARRIAAVEILGAVTFLCADKTGTLTQNKMSICTLFNQGEFYNVSKKHEGPLPELFHDLIEFGILASKKDPFDPMEKALKELGGAQLKKTEHLHPDWSFMAEYPLSKEILALSHVWKTYDQKYMVACKGAPETVIDLCHLNKKEKDEILKNVHILASDGLRVLGIA
ncbi:MAG: HAD-IC family P-type ATPase, partial [Candidatus Peregrinibacteria bacterium]